MKGKCVTCGRDVPLWRRLLRRKACGALADCLTYRAVMAAWMREQYEIQKIHGPTLIEITRPWEEQA